MTDAELHRLNTDARYAHNAGAFTERDNLLDLAATQVMETGDPGGHPSNREE